MNKVLKCILSLGSKRNIYSKKKREIIENKPVNGTSFVGISYNLWRLFFYS